MLFRRPSRDTSARLRSLIRPKYLVPLSILLLHVHASAADYRFESWSTADGLPQNSIMAIHQTRDGYLWLATFDGLVRYDGAQFRVFDKAGTDGVSSNRCVSLAEDAEGSLWIGTEEGFLMRRRGGRFESYRLPNDMFPAQIQVIRDGGRDGILLWTTRGHVRWQNGRFLARTAEDGEPPPRLGFPVPSGALWYSDAAGLHRLQGAAKTTYTSRDGIPSLELRAAVEDRAGNVWLAGRGELYRWSNGAWSTHGATEGITRSDIQALCEDHEGNLWVATRHGLFRHASGKFVRYTRADGLPSDGIRTVFTDREGSVWIGTLDAGLARASRRIVTVLSERSGLSSDVVYPIYQDRAGDLWLGTRGLDRVAGGAVRRLPNGIARNNYGITALAEDRLGRLWIGAVGGVGWLRGGRFHVETFGEGKLFSSILEDRSGSLWLGTNTGLLSTSDAGVRLYTTRDGLAGNDVKVLCEDARGTLWVGTFGGLSRFEGGRFRSYSERDGLGSNHVRALYEDSEATLWIGTYDGGLARLKAGKFTRYTSRDGLFNNGVFQILEDSRRNLWMSCNRGIYRVSKRQLDDFADGKIASIESISIGKEDGLENLECNGGRQPAGIRARDGKLWFPTQGGAAVIDPEAVRVSPLPPPVLVESCVLDGKAVPFDRGVRMAPGQENLEIHYTGLSFIKPSRVTFRYRLSGVDDGWVFAGTRRTAYYSHLRPGTYRFTIAAANSDGVWNTRGAEIDVVVVPPFWSTLWFSLTSLGGLLAVAGVAYRRKMHALQREQQAREAFARSLIESQESERKRIAAGLHDSIGQDLLIIKNRAVLASREPGIDDAVRAELGQISSLSSQALEEVREIAHNLRPFLIDRLGLTTAIESMVESVRDSVPIEFDLDIESMDGILSKDAEINLYRILQESVNNIVKHSSATRARIAAWREENVLHVSIEDDGVGFPVEERGKGASGRHVFGLAAIAERVRILSGTLAVRSAPGKGTTLALEIPCGGSRNEE